MKTLSQTWFTEGYIDFELKKYTLLAYLQEIDRLFGQQRLYPHLADLIAHYQNLLLFRHNKELLQQHFPKRLSEIDMKNLESVYQSIIEDDALMLELENIIGFAEKRMDKTIRDGTSIYEFVEEHLDIFPVGLVPLEHHEGYFFLRVGRKKQVLVYQYSIGLVEKKEERFRSLKTEFIAEWIRSIANTYEGMKVELIRKHKSLPNPAVYCIETAYSMPMEETLLPIAKRTLARYLAIN